MKILKLKLGLLIVCLIVFLNACVSSSQPPPRAVHPPTVYLQTILEPVLKSNTNAHLLEWALDLRTALRLANKDKQALRDWLEEYDNL